ncbi:helix-turn-helix domain-containing protein [Clostridium sp. HBUAS56017]|uniref:helix-turn-helix domain-containing protein n=1 Tax=Clostridium sp. HBUAS56017 TaxID=2571128 RepID=UPI001177DB72|nr:helix-turn-helix domain-containing protein [Clostridium sp. HBUAS56017]
MFNWDDLLSLKEAADKYGREESTLRRAISNGKLVEGVDCKKFGKQWVILDSSMERIYIDERKNLKK